MNNTISRIFGTFVLFAGFGIAQTEADETGLATALHEVKKEKGRVCMVTHYHSGNGTARNSKRQAIKVAIKNWEEFTTWEYGSDWGKFRRARSRGQSCNKSGNSWNCSVRARPCRSRR